ncbi:MAG: nucleoside monophosphate kinase, partial [Lachnospiraceae bacterium]|nr:nucleoside monophosphate kinase [Lachnospiraceae bacterium]
CGATYHVEWLKPQVEGICDKCGSELVLRDDDKPETVRTRLSVYHEQTQPLIDYYKAEGVLKDVDGTVDMKDVFESIVKVLGA